MLVSNGQSICGITDVDRLTEDLVCTAVAGAKIDPLRFGLEAESMHNDPRLGQEGPADGHVLFTADGAHFVTGEIYGRALQINEQAGFPDFSEVIDRAVCVHGDTVILDDGSRATNTALAKFVVFLLSREANTFSMQS